jgi:uncharacterized membrane protein YeaQ/YmgE (transglycosylase-associated protein family)
MLSLQAQTEGGTAMLELLGWNVGMTSFATLVLVIGGVVIGAIAQYIGRVEIGYEWIFAVLGAVVGGWLGSEAFGTLSTWGPALDGLYVLPALVGALVLGGLVDVAVRVTSGGSYLTTRPI